MTSFEKCYSDLIKEYIRLSTQSGQYEDVLEYNYLNGLSCEELENLSIAFNSDNPIYAAYLAGIAVSNTVDSMQNLDDIDSTEPIIDKFLDLVGVAEHDENNITARKDIKCKTPKEEWSDVELNTLNMLLEQSLRIVESHNCEPEGTIDTTECHLRKYLSKAKGCVDTIKTVGAKTISAL